jgi:hypothetical protein
MESRIICTVVIYALKITYVPPISLLWIHNPYNIQLRLQITKPLNIFFASLQSNFTPCNVMQWKIIRWYFRFSRQWVWKCLSSGMLYL